MEDKADLAGTAMETSCAKSRLVANERSQPYRLHSHLQGLDQVDDISEPGCNVGTTSEVLHESAKVFTMLGNTPRSMTLETYLIKWLSENNPKVMNDLAYRLGVSKKLSFYDVYSLHDSDMLAMIPRPVFALLATIPMTEAWKQSCDAEDARLDWYKGAGPEEPVIWFQQTIIHGCGLIGFLHCVCNGVPSKMITPGSELASFLEKAVPLGMDDRAKLLSETELMYEASEEVALKGDTKPLDPGVSTGNHFVALVKARDGHLWELEGSRKGPLERGFLSESEDVLSERALELGIKNLIDIQRESGSDLIFSCIALALSAD